MKITACKTGMLNAVVCMIFANLFFSKISYASNYVFNINANFTTSSCTVSTENLTFNFYMNAVDLQTAGRGSDWQSGAGQTIALTNCFGGTHSVEASVSGIMDDDDKDGFKNQSNANPATGISVQLKSGEQVLHNNDVISANVNDLHGIDIPLAARLYTAKGNSTPGDVYAVINLTLTYK